LARVRYDVPCEADITVDLLDAAGRVLGTLSAGRHEPGRYVVNLRRVDVTSDPSVATRAGRQTLGGGVYFVRLASAGFKAVRKVVLVR
jgi:hypothetical protein